MLQKRAFITQAKAVQTSVDKIHCEESKISRIEFFDKVSADIGAAFLECLSLDNIDGHVVNASSERGGGVIGILCTNHGRRQRREAHMSGGIDRIGQCARHVCHRAIALSTDL